MVFFYYNYYKKINIKDVVNYFKLTFKGNVKAIINDDINNTVVIKSN